MQGSAPIFEKLKKARQYIATALITVLGVGLIYFILVSALTPKRYNLVVGEPAPTTITATKQVVDEVTTKQNVASARAAVESIYKLDESVLTELAAGTAAAFDSIDVYRAQYQEDIERFQTDGMSVYMPSVSLCDSLREALSPLEITRADASELLRAPASNLSALKTAYIQSVTAELENGIREGDLAADKDRIYKELQMTLLPSSAVYMALVGELNDVYLTANFFFDEEATEAARVAAEAEAETAIYKKGQNVVVANEIVTEAQFAVVQTLGLLEDDSVDMSMYLGLALMCLLVFVMLALYPVMFDRALMGRPKDVLLIFIVFLAVLTLGLLLRSINIYLIPVQLGIFLLALLLGRRLAIVFGAGLAVLVGILATGDEGLLTAGMFNILMLAIISCTATVSMTRRASQRLSLVYSGLIVGAVNFATMFSIGLLTTSSMSETLVSAAFAAGGGLLSSVLAMALTPVFEMMFSIVTPQKLMELSNPNHALLRRLQTEAPGTYHHSLIVANLAEAAAHDIGANELLARVGAYYHDAGKLMRPLMFKENQLGGENPHDSMDPYVSAAVITAHTTDGVALAEKHKLPRQLTDIIAQHHGQTCAAYFYYRALKRAEETGETVNQQDFAYVGPKPATKEACLVFLADTVEAAVRSMKTHAAGEMEALVRKLIAGRLSDGQLADAPVTLSELETATRSFLRVLSGFYHDRVEYPELEKKAPAALQAAEGTAAEDTPQAAADGAGSVFPVASVQIPSGPAPREGERK